MQLCNGSNTNNILNNNTPNKIVSPNNNSNNSNTSNNASNNNTLAEALEAITNYRKCAMTFSQDNDFLG